MIGSLRLRVDLGCVDFLLKTSVMSKNLVLLCEGNLVQVLYILGNLKYIEKMRPIFHSVYLKVSGKWFKEYNCFRFYQYSKEALPPNIPKYRLNDVVVLCFVDERHAGNHKDGRIQIGVLVFVNRSWVHKAANNSGSKQLCHIGL